MTDLEPPCPDKSEVFRPELRADLIEQTSHLVQDLGLDGRATGESEADAMESYWDLRGECVQRPTLATCAIKEVIGYDLEEIDTIEVFDDTGGKIRPPTETDSIFHGIHISASASATPATTATAAAASPSTAAGGRATGTI